MKSKHMKGWTFAHARDPPPNWPETLMLIRCWSCSLVRNGIKKRRAAEKMKRKTKKAGRRREEEWSEGSCPLYWWKTSFGDIMAWYLTLYLMLLLSIRLYGTELYFSIWWIYNDETIEVSTQGNIILILIIIIVMIINTFINDYSFIASLRCWFVLMSK